VLGGKKILDDEGNYIIRLIAPDEVIDIAAALEPIDKKRFAKDISSTARALGQSTVRRTANISGNISMRSGISSSVRRAMAALSSSRPISRALIEADLAFSTR